MEYALETILRMEYALEKLLTSHGIRTRKATNFAWNTQ